MQFSDNEMKLARFFVEREGEGILEEIHDMDFMESGILDSLDMVSLAVFIERSFGIRLDLTEETTFDAARRFDSLMDLIQDGVAQ